MTHKNIHSHMKSLDLLFYTCAVFLNFLKCNLQIGFIFDIVFILT